MLLLVFIIGVGCKDEQSDRLREMEQRLHVVDSLLRVQDRLLPAYARLGPVSCYQLSDIDRDSKNVGRVYSKHSFSKGDRIFLRDDIWDIVYVKAFTKKTFAAENYIVGGSADIESYNVDSIELLVKFGGKATDPKQQP